MIKIIKTILMIVTIITILISTNVYAATETTDVIMKVVEDNICTIKINEESEFEKKIINKELEKYKITLQLKISNNSEVIIPEGELMLVIDSSMSMDETIDEQGTTRKDAVLNSANKLVNGLLEANPTTLEIGVVTFSSSSEKNEEGFLATGTDADAQKVCDFTNDIKTLNEKISSIEGKGQYTNLDAGIQLAKKQFSKKDANKYMIILTDGLPNLAVGYNDLVTYKGMTDVINQTKTTLKSLENVEVITMLTGIDNGEAILREDAENSYTYNQVIKEVFGSEQNPSIGKFYNIADTEIEETIAEKIYKDLIPIENTLTNIKIIDYIPQEIAENFDVVINEESKELKAIISEDKRTITWEIEELKAGETKSLKFDIILKDSFNKEIIDKILDTNEKVDISYNDFDGNEEEKTSDVTPKIKLSEVVQPAPEPEKPKDNTTAPKVIPDAGTPKVIYVLLVSIVMAIVIYIKYRKIK